MTTSISNRSSSDSRPLVVVGAGPSGLMAAERIAAAGLPVEVFDAMPTAGRKFLLAGRGGLNITHSEPLEPFLARYAERRERIAPLLDAFSPEMLRDWVHGLGIETFIGSSGRVFPRQMKAGPLLRGWLHRLRAQGVRLRMRHRWDGGIDTGAPSEAPLSLRFEAPEGPVVVEARAVVLALGGASWPHLGSDGAWVGPIQSLGIPVAPLQPSNCGFDLDALGGRSEQGWSPFFRDRFAGQAVKTVAARIAPLAPKVPAAADGAADTSNTSSTSSEAGSSGASVDALRTGDFVITDTGVEGTLIYALSAELREAIAARGRVELLLDLAPGRSHERLANELARPRGGNSLANHLRSRAGIAGVKAGLLRELFDPQALAAVSADAGRLAHAIKALPLPLVAARPLPEAISTAGGIRFEALDETLMLKATPGVFVAGEMLDWEAPTGGYLLTACFASGQVAGDGAVRYVTRRAPEIRPADR